jgi:subtilase family serine protease
LIFVTVKNQGNGPAIFNFRSIILGSAELYNKEAYPGEVRIEPNGTTELFLTKSNPIPGMQTWSFTVDPRNIISESNENNNSKSVQVDVLVPDGAAGQKPDLIIVSFNFFPENATTADRISVSMRFRNQGAGVAVFPRGTAYVEFTNPKTGNQIKWNMSLDMAYAPGEEFSSGQNMFNPQELPAGNYTTLVRVDPDNRIDESNENNNTYTYNWALAQGGLPDLVINDIHIDPPAGGDTTYSIFVTIKNQGNAPALFNFRSIILGSPELYNKDANPGEIRINPNETYRLFLTKSHLAPGLNMWNFTVDPNNVVNESNEMNNTGTAQIQVP